jgi:RND family efflux transporter MFP subunit
MNALKWMLRLGLTAALVAVATIAGLRLWQHEMKEPWTRDGRVRADVINLAPDVSGLVAEVAVHDNQLVHRNEVLMRVDPQRYEQAVAQAKATLASRRAELAQRQDAARRRASVQSIVVAEEQVQAANFALTAAQAQVAQAEAALAAAELDLQRTEVRAPADGYVTNLTTFTGDYATAGRPALALVRSDSYYVYGYFEETRLARMSAGDAAEVRLLDGRRLRGHVDSISRGITDRDNPNGPALLSNVNPTFDWVRLAQRVPVRIALDAESRQTTLVAGTTCSVIVHPGARASAAQSGNESGKHEG